MGGWVVFRQRGWGGTTSTVGKKKFEHKNLGEGAGGGHHIGQRLGCYYTGGPLRRRRDIHPGGGRNVGIGPEGPNTDSGLGSCIRREAFFGCESLDMSDPLIQIVPRTWCGGGLFVWQKFICPFLSCTVHLCPPPPPGNCHLPAPES